jgi:succinate dehydrogenase / fumarate reductase flavoprotein subunit
MSKLNARIPEGPLAQKWTNYKDHQKLVNPANKRKLDVIVVGTGLAGASAAASLGEMGFNVKNFTIQDSPRRAHSIAAQGGINAAKNYPNDGDSVFRLFYDTIKGGDYRAREANVYRLAEVSNSIIDQCVAQGVPFAREYGGLLDNRSFGGAQVSRTFYAKGQTGQQLLLGAYQALMRQVNAGTVKMYTRTELVDIVIVDGKARGIIARDLVTGELQRHFVTPLFWQPVAMEIPSSFRPMRWGRTDRLPSKLITKEPCLPIHVSLRFTQPVSRFTANFRAN